MKKPYVGRKLRKVKGGYEAVVYVLACGSGKTKAKALNDLARVVWEMECHNKGCCVPKTFTASTGNFSSVAQFMVSTK